MMHLLLRAAALLLILAPVLAATPVPRAWAASGDASPWDKGFHTRARLVIGEVRREGAARTVVAGVHVKMDKGWKTYWRNPGDSGIPPEFDWSGSSNVKRVEVRWPAPRRFTDPYGSSIGYKDEIVFPVLIETTGSGEPLELRLKLAYAICKDVCIPAEAALKLTVGAPGDQAMAFKSLIGRYLSIVPEKTASAAGAPAIRKVAARLSKPSPHLLIDAEFPRGTKGADLFVEAPEEFYVPLPKRLGVGDGRLVRFKVDLSQGDDPALLKGKSLTLTLVSDGAQAETTWRVD